MCSILGSVLRRDRNVQIFVLSTYGILVNGSSGTPWTSSAVNAALFPEGNPNENHFQMRQRVDFDVFSMSCSYFDPAVGCLEKYIDCDTLE